jgi:hypothetical protein
MIDWALALSTASQALKFANDLRQIDKEVSQADLKLKIAELTETLADLKIMLTEAKVDAAEKDSEIERLKTLHRRLVDDVVELDGYKYRKRQDGKGPAAGYPFCNVCFQKNGLLFETTQVQEAGMPVQCPNCRAKYISVRTFTD